MNETVAEIKPAKIVTLQQLEHVFRKRLSFFAKVLFLERYDCCINCC